MLYAALSSQAPLTGLQARCRVSTPVPSALMMAMHPSFDQAIFLQAPLSAKSKKRDKGAGCIYSLHPPRRSSSSRPSIRGSASFGELSWKTPNSISFAVCCGCGCGWSGVDADDV